MQFKTIAISAFLGLAAATSSTDVSSLVNQLPSCSLICLMSSASTAGCGATDYTCQCNNQAAVTADATTCLTSSCTATEIGTTKSVSSQICEAITGKNSTSTSTSGSASNSTATTGSSSASTASSTSASTSTTSDTSLGSRPEVFGLGLAALSGLTGLMVYL